MEKFNVCLFRADEKYVDIKDCKGSIILKSIKDIKQESLQKEIFHSLYYLFDKNDMIDYDEDGFDFNYDMIGTIHVYTYAVNYLPFIIALINTCNTLGLPLEFHLYTYRGNEKKCYHYEINDEVDFD